jgi:iron(III) transport system permease protein
MSASASLRPAFAQRDRGIARLRRWPWITAGGAAIAGALVLLPLVFLVVQAQQSGWGEVERLLLRHTVAVLLLNSLKLTAACTALCALLGVGAAWLVERTDLPARRLWAVLLVLPLGIPDFVIGFGWVSIAPGLHGYLAAVLVMTLSLYPLVYLPVAGALARSDAGLEEAARSLGAGPLQTFTRVTLRQIRPALLGGCLLVTLALLAEYGAFEITRYQTFTVAIFTQFKLGFDAVGACVLALVLVALSVAALAGEQALGGARGAARQGPGAKRPPRRVRLGSRRLPAVGAVAALCGLALGVPCGALVYWMAHGSSTTLPSASILGALGHTVEYGAAAAVLACALAVPVTSLVVRHPGRLSVLLERLTYLPIALPGLVVALGLLAFTVRHAIGLYESATELIVAYTILFLPLAVVSMRAAMINASRRLEDVARSLGCSGPQAWLRVTLPLIAPGLRAAAALVLISSATELTATLLLRPIGVDTLATQFWAYTTEFSYGAAAPYAAVMVAISAVPAYLLSRRMRLPGEQAR